MAEENQSLEQIVNEAKKEHSRGPMREPTIALETYDKKTFLGYYGRFGDLIRGTYVQALNENINNLKAREGLTGVLFGDFNAHRAFEPSDLLKTAQISYEQGAESLARYAHHNKNKFLSVLNEEALMRLVSVLPMYENGQKEHDELVQLLNERREMVNIAQEKDENAKNDKIKSFMKARMQKDNGLTKEGKSLFAYLMQSDKIAEYMFGRIFNDTQKLLKLSLSMQEGDALKPDKAKHRMLIENSLEVIEKEMDEKTDEKDKDKIWDEKVKPYYTNISHAAYESEKKSD